MAQFEGSLNDSHTLKMFGEEIRSRKKRNIAQEMMLKVSLYNEFMVA